MRQCSRHCTLPQLRDINAKMAKIDKMTGKQKVQEALVLLVAQHSLTSSLTKRGSGQNPAGKTIACVCTISILIQTKDSRMKMARH